MTSHKGCRCKLSQESPWDRIIPEADERWGKNMKGNGNVPSQSSRLQGAGYREFHRVHPSRREVNRQYKTVNKSSLGNNIVILKCRSTDKVFCYPWNVTVTKCCINVDSLVSCRRESHHWTEPSAAVSLMM